MVEWIANGSPEESPLSMSILTAPFLSEIEYLQRELKQTKAQRAQALETVSMLSTQLNEMENELGNLRLQLEMSRTMKESREGNLQTDEPLKLCPYLQDFYMDNDVVGVQSKESASPQKKCSASTLHNESDVTKADENASMPILATNQNLTSQLAQTLVYLEEWQDVARTAKQKAATFYDELICQRQVCDSLRQAIQEQDTHYQCVITAYKNSLKQVHEITKIQSKSTSGLTAQSELISIQNTLRKFGWIYLNESDYSKAPSWQVRLVCTEMSNHIRRLLIQETKTQSAWPANRAPKLNHQKFTCIS